jgi:uncharacterized protein
LKRFFQEKNHKISKMLTPLLIGLAGSLHCVGMCGPLVLAVFPGQGQQTRILAPLAVYHMGRIGGYSLLGLLFGNLGKAIYVAGLQQYMSILAGVVLLLAAGAAMGWRFSGVMPQRWMQKQHSLSKALGRLLSKGGRSTYLGLGLMNGFLPCGLTYGALAGAIAMSSAWDGAQFMLWFGLGTLPLLLALQFSGIGLRKKLRAWRWAKPALLALAGFLLIYRGLQLDLELFNATVPPAGADCHY